MERIIGVLIIVSILGMFAYVKFSELYIRKDKIPSIYIKSKCIAIMYLQKKITELQRELDNNQDGSTTFCAEYDIDRLKETVDFLEKF